ncbi:MAG: CBS domain-containing protein [Mucilaginibacter polytrichastri]|nr:CBS domain-containing protein [Mucilaginibacter polytrichastri]
MLAFELLSDAIPPLRTSDTVRKALDRMAEFRIAHMPVVNQEQFLGLVAEEDLIEASATEQPIGNVELSLLNPFVFENQHIYDVITLLSMQKLTIVPVLDLQRNYLGVISINSMNEYFAQITSANEPGAIIVLEISNRENSMTQIAQIIESENAQILSSYIRTFPDSTRLELTIKVNKREISAIVAGLLRYNYTIKATHHTLEIDNGSLNRYEQLMNYLNI